MKSLISHNGFYEAIAFQIEKFLRFELEYVMKESKKNGNLLEESILKNIHTILIDL